MNTQKCFIKTKNLHGKFSIDLKRQTQNFEKSKELNGGKKK